MTRALTIVVSDKLWRHLGAMVDEDGWGDSYAEVVERLVWDGVHDAMARGLIDRTEIAVAEPEPEEET